MQLNAVYIKRIKATKVKYNYDSFEVIINTLCPVIFHQRLAINKEG